MTKLLQRQMLLPKFVVYSTIQIVLAYPAALFGFTYHSLYSLIPLRELSKTSFLNPVYPLWSNDDRSTEINDISLPSEPILSTTSSSSAPENVLFTKDYQRTIGILVLLTVPVCWGTYGVVVKFVYQLQPPVPGLLFSAAYYSVAAVTLLFLSALSSQQKHLLTTENKEVECPKAIDSSSFSNDYSTTKWDSMIPVQVTGGLELGSYLILGNALQVTGLQTVPADRAAFLVQLTTIIVPILQAIFARSLKSISARTWIACFIAFFGVVTMELDGRFDISTAKSVIQPLDILYGIPPLSLEVGDILLILSSVAYSFHVLRLQKYATQMKPLTLATSKAVVESVLSVLMVLFLFFLYDPTITSFSNSMSKDVVDFFSVATSESNFFSSLDQTRELVGAVLWTGIITCAYTIYAQSFGQQRLKPTEASLIYSSQPIFSSIFAFFFLGETLGPLGVIGGAMVAAAVAFVALTPLAPEKTSRNS
jgi:drug/metabolite transporter (DMT)-like permease